jgi:TolA-binding protein
MAKLTDDLENANRRIKDLSHKKEEMELFSFKIRKFEKENEALSTQLAGIKTACEKQKN